MKLLEVGLDAKTASVSNVRGSVEDWRTPLTERLRTGASPVDIRLCLIALVLAEWGSVNYRLYLDCQGPSQTSHRYSFPTISIEVVA